MTRKLLAGLLTGLLLMLTPGVLTGVQAAMLTVGGTGSASSLLELLFDEFQKQHPETTTQVINPPLGSGGALKALAAGRIHMALLGMPLAAEQAGKFGQHFALAQTPFVMASSSGQRRNGFTLDELAQVYTGSLSHWDSGELIRLLLRASQESDTLTLRDMSPAMEQAVLLAAQRPGMATADNDIDTLNLIAKIPGSLGPCTLGLIATMEQHVTVYPINGVTPSIATMAKGDYPWSKTLYVVLPRDPSPEAVAFARFLRSPAAKHILQRNDYLPLTNE